jgi:hypothetical protein
LLQGKALKESDGAFGPPTLAAGIRRPMPKMLFKCLPEEGVMPPLRHVPVILATLCIALWSDIPASAGNDVVNGPQYAFCIWTSGPPSRREYVSKPFVVDGTVVINRRIASKNPMDPDFPDVSYWIYLKAHYPEAANAHSFVDLSLYGPPTECTGIVATTDESATRIIQENIGNDAKSGYVAVFTGWKFTGPGSLASYPAHPPAVAPDR